MTRRALANRVANVRRAAHPEPPPSFLAYARVVVEFGGGDPAGYAAVDLARWLARGGQEGERCWSG